MPGGRLEALDRAGKRQKAAGRVFGVQAELEGMALRFGVFGHAQRLAVRDTELFEHQVDAAGGFGHRMLDLQPRVHFQKRNLAFGAHQIFDRAGAGIAGLAADRLGRAMDFRALVVGEKRRRRFFHELLVAPLQRAVAGADHDDVAVAVGEDLGLDVARRVEKTLHEALAAAEGGLAFAHGRVEGILDIVLAAHDLHAAAAAAEGRLDDDRQAVFLGEFTYRIGVIHRAVGAGHERRAGGDRDLARGDLVAQLADRRGDGPIQVSPASITAWAKSAFSERKP